MKIPEIFLSEFWELWSMICAIAFGLSIGLVVRLASSRCLTFFTRTKSFPELAAFSKADQERLLREASKEAFGALSFVPILVFLASWWVAAAFLRTLEKVTALPVWAAAVMIGLLSGLSYWLGRRLEVDRVRVFLKKIIDEQNGKTSA
jgi:hypothetical protein